MPEVTVERDYNSFEHLLTKPFLIPELCVETVSLHFSLLRFCRKMSC